MDSLQLLMGGFATALQPQNLLFAFIGCAFGTFMGVVPGIGPTTGIAMLIPLTFYLDLTPSIIMLSGIYYGAMYGGTITSVLMNVPGDAASAISCAEGHPMAKSGRAGAALSMAAIGSFVGGSIATAALVFVAVPLGRLALNIGPVEMCSLMVLAMTLVTGLAGKSMPKALVSACAGVLIGTVGMDPAFGMPRFTFGKIELFEGVNIVPVVVGLYGLGEILNQAESPVRGMIHAKVNSLLPSRQDVRDCVGAILRGSGIGFVCGLVPGVGVVVPTFMSYALERRISKTPEKWGKGVIQGLVGPETANNTTANAALLPLFTLGLPGSANVALLVGAFMMKGVIPAPGMFEQHGDVVWAVIASLWIGNAMLLIMNLPLIPLWVQVLKIPYAYMFALILTFVVLGSYTINGSMFDVGLTVFFGVVGYAFQKLDIPSSPLIMTMILSQIIERSMRRALAISDGSFGIFTSEPISMFFLSAAIIVLIVVMMGRTPRKGRKLASIDGDIPPTGAGIA